MPKKEAGKAFSLDSLDISTPSNAGFEVELLHPSTREPLGMFVKVLGKNSDVFIAHKNRAANEYLRRAQQLKKRGKEDEAYTVEKGEERSIALLAACTVGWRTGDKPVLNFNGSDHPFTTENAATLYSSNKWAWLREQIDEAIADDANFLKS